MREALSLGICAFDFSEACPVILNQLLFLKQDMTSSWTMFIIKLLDENYWYLLNTL